MKKESLILLICFLFYSCPPQPELGAYNKMTYSNAKGEQLGYNILYPLDFKLGTKKKYPLVLFLHGAGERGNDNELQLLHISKNFLEPSFLKEHKAIVVFPQCPKEDYWVKQKNFNVDSKKQATQAMALVMELMEELINSSYVKKEKVYVTGLSMGGMGTFDLLARKPEWFAAGIAVCGAADLDLVERYKDIPLQIFHGEKDSVVPFEKSQEVYDALKLIADKSSLTSYPDDGHLIWDKVYEKNVVLDWLLKQ